MTTGAGAAAQLMLAWAHVSDLALFCAIWVGIGLTMAAVLYEPAFVVIATWFRDRAERTRALLALTVVVGFASAIYVPLAGWLVQTYGWRQALIVAELLGWHCGRRWVTRPYGGWLRPWSRPPWPPVP